jgi:hypothetical protein
MEVDAARTGPARGRAAAWVAWSTVALAVLLTVLHLTWWTLADDVPGALDSRGEAGLPIAFTLMGALIVTRQPGNRIGWLFCAGPVFALTGALDAYALYALAARPDAGLPGATAAAWVSSWSWAVGAPLVVLLPLIYPTGRLPSPRWRPVVWLTGLLLVLSSVSYAFRPGPLEASQVPVAANPFGMAGAGPLLEVLDAVGGVLSVALFLAAVASVLLRFRRAAGVERQQLKWFAYASVGVVLGFMISSAVNTAVGARGELVGDLFASGLTIGWPVALGIAVLRYRLFEIDRLINRTLVYGLLTALLAGVYAGLVLLGGLLFGDLGGRAPSWAVAAATLAVAALFQPARRRIQAVVDRSFNRRRYDAARTVEAFSARLRDQVDLDTLEAELLAVVDTTVQPTRMSLWLRSPNPG